jgi:hypothetical protein
LDVGSETEDGTIRARIDIEKLLKVIRAEN